MLDAIQNYLDKDESAKKTKSGDIKAKPKAKTSMSYKLVTKERNRIDSKVAHITADDINPVYDYCATATREHQYNTIEGRQNGSIPTTATDNHFSDVQKQVKLCKICRDNDYSSECLLKKLDEKRAAAAENGAAL